MVWWRHVTESEPFSTPAALGLMRALEAAGDPTAAVEHARRHAARLRDELECPVADEIVSFVPSGHRRSAVDGLSPDAVELQSVPKGAAARRRLLRGGGS